MQKVKMKQPTKIIIGNCTLYHGDCFDILPNIDVDADAVISDPPYNTTVCDWDVYIPLAHWWCIVSDKCKASANYVLFAAGHFAIDLANSKYNWYRYDLVWHKNNRVGFFNAGKQPMWSHENILIFGKPGWRDSSTYNPQFEDGGRKDGRQRHVRISGGGVYPRREYFSKTDGGVHPSSVLHYCKEKAGQHPTQKSAALLEFLVRSYSNENALVLDPFMGSGTTGIACVKSGRRFIGIEKEEKFFNIAVERVRQQTADSR